VHQMSPPDGGVYIFIGGVTLRRVSGRNPTWSLSLETNLILSLGSTCTASLLDLHIHFHFFLEKGTKF
jgi:hypothetical protein